MCGWAQLLVMIWKRAACMVTRKLLIMRSIAHVCPYLTQAVWLCAYVFMPVCVYISCLCVRACMYECICVRVFVCLMYVRSCECMYVYV